MQFTYVEIMKVQPGQMDEILRKVEDELLPLYRQSPGFVAYTIAKTDEVSATALSIWQTRQQAEHARNIREDWEKKETAASIESFHNAIGSLPFLTVTRDLVGYTSVMPAAARHA
jgi:heme-degrading monooxygenase HmoA